MANERDGEAPASASAGRDEVEPASVLWLCNCGTHTSAVAIERRGWYKVKEHLTPEGAACFAPAERYGNGRHLLDALAGAKWSTVRDAGSNTEARCVTVVVGSEAEVQAALLQPWSTVRKEELDRLRAIEAAAKVFVGRTASIGEDHPAYGFLVMGIPLARVLAGDTALVDFALDRASTWRVLGTDPERAERDNCWQAPSVASALDRLKAIETAAVAYRDAVLAKRALDSRTCLRTEYKAAVDDKRAKGEALFALLLPVQREALAAMEKKK